MRSPTSTPRAKYLAEVRAVAEMLVDAGLLRDHVLLSAGGSAYFDVVADVLGGPDVSGVPSTTILRSGAYLTHDHGTYAGSTPFTRIAATSTRRCGSGRR